MVVLSGSLTRLVPYITDFDKTYEAVISFGVETDTLDPTGDVIKTAPLPLAASLTGAISRFRGTIDQKPPQYSAIHVGGKRASDIAKKGGTVNIPSRKVTVYSSEILEMQTESGETVPAFDLSSAGELIKYARVRFHVSKGTYIRSLARDIAEACGSAGHLAGLVRTQVGSFSLSEAVGAELLKPFTISNVLAELSNNAQPSDEKEDELRQQVCDRMMSLTVETAHECGLTSATLKSNYEKSFFNGRPLKADMFVPADEKEGPVSGNTAVFTEDGLFAGVISSCENRLRYQYVVPRPQIPEAGENAPIKADAASKNDVKTEITEENSETVVTDRADRRESVSGSVLNLPSEWVSEDGEVIRIFSWDDIMASRNNENSEVRSFFKDGSALTIGGFDGPHAGHLRLFESVLRYADMNEQQSGVKLKKGIVTFRQPPHSVTAPDQFPGDISTLPLKLDLFTMKGFDFVLVIDFSSDFSRMKGNDFLSILKDCCSMQFAAAGYDFRCGYQLDTGVAELSAFARQNDFQFQVIDDVMRNGVRISSSLIRNCVQSGQLREAEMLLGRPYTVDLRNVAFEVRNDFHCLLQIAHGDVLQILPPNGTYLVNASAGTWICNTVLYVDSSLLRLEIPPEWSSTGIDKIEFTTLVS